VIFEQANIQCLVNPIETAQYPTAAKRPHYSLLNKSAIKGQFNLRITYCKESLVNCMDTMHS
jgi:dTDP-4-dehydrorhamnose reductase